MSPEVSQLLTNAIEWAFLGLTGTCFAFAVNYLRGISISIEQLNKQVAVIIAKSEEYERRLSQLENR